MTRKEFIEHYNNILNFPDLGIYSKKADGLKDDIQKLADGLKDEIQKLADIDKISYPLALDKIYSVFFSQYLETDPDDSNFKDIEKATNNLLFLSVMEGLDHSLWSIEC